jgi:hypothetical protein
MTRAVIPTSVAGAAAPTRASTGHANRIVAEQDAHTVARKKLLVRVLDHRHQLSRIQTDANFKPRPLCDAPLGSIARDATEYSAADTRCRGTAAAADIAACRDPAQRGARNGTDTGRARLDRDGPHGFDHTELDHHHLLRLGWRKGGARSWGFAA